MNFKLIAIRPLEGCDRSIIKGLVPNCIYQFYNEYDFYFKKTEKSQQLLSFIEYQKTNLTFDSTEKYSPLNYKTICAIKRTEEVPKNLFAQNINISAIVGQNGSGKSTLLELFYYLMYKYSTKYNLVQNKKDTNSNRKLEIEIFYEDENYDVIIHRYSEKEDSLKIYDIKSGNFHHLSDESYSDLLSYQCYSIALNYSIYGLNSEVSGNWLDALFHKNDGYRTPIVINPFRESGNIDINNEYILAQSRLLLNYYLVNNNSLLDDVQISTIKFKLEILKHQYAEKYEDKMEQNLTVSVSDIYEKVIRHNSSYRNLTRDQNINALINKVLDRGVIIDYTDGKFIYKDSNGSLSTEFKELFINSDIQHPELKVLNALYILKKIYKITQNYKEYEIFKQLFTSKDFNYNAIGNHNLTVSRREIISIYSEYFYRVFLAELEEYFEKQYINYADNSSLTEIDKIKLTEYLEKIEYGTYRNLEVRSLDTGYFNIIFDGYVDLRKSGYIDIGATYVTTDAIIKFISNTISTNLKNDENYSLRDSVRMAVDYFLNQNIPDININLNVSELNNLLFLKLYSDESHVTFKLKQAISYFNEDLFENIEGYHWDSFLETLDIDLNQEYLKNRSIKTMPLAFVQPIVMVVKTTETDERKIRLLIDSKKLDEYPFNQLSSGEQQLIHSILTIVYHLYNLKSIDDKLYKQTKINLIFDEIELYFHPEYQRVYISSLLQALARIDVNKGLKFNILLSTHSPFILSDIPSQNILKLKNGIPVMSDTVNSFAANIYDLLNDEFFLKKGTIGAYASNKINDIMQKELVEKEDYDILNLIGDPFLRGVITKQLNKKNSKEHILNEIDRLQSLLNNLEDATN